MRRPRRFPVSYQLDQKDCGPTCLDMIAKYHGRKYPIQQIRDLCRQGSQGTTLASIARAAEQLGFRTLSVKLSFEDIKDKAPLPCIVFWPHGHYVVVYRIRENQVHIADPSGGLAIYSREEFESCWLMETAHENWGVALLLEPTKSPTVPQSSTRRLISHDLWWPIWREIKRYLIPILIGVSVVLLAQLILPFLSAAIVDVGIINRDLRIVVVILVAEMALLVSRLTINLLQSFLLAYIGLRIHITLVSQFLAKLTRLPIAFFDGKLTGDLLQRINDHKILQQLLTDSVWQVFLALLSLTVFGTVLAVYKPLFFAVFIAGTIAYLTYTSLFLRRQRVLSVKNFHLSAQKQSFIVEFLAGMHEIKLNNAEQQRRWQWEATQHAISKIQIKSQLLTHLQNNGGVAINEAVNFILTLLVARDVISGSMSLGSMVAIQFILGQMSWPLSYIAMLLAQSHEGALSYQRAREIHEIPDEDHSSNQPPPAGCADIEFSNVSFGYEESGKKRLFRNLNLTIPRGKTTAIVGRSGSGKTTLLKLILKYYPVNSGEITVGGEQLDRISCREWRDRCGIVMQDGYIFSDTILNNIAVATERIDMGRMLEVTRIAQIDSFINSLPLSYDTRIGRDGVGISRGQAQRILIARALYKNPNYLFFDEATSALDAETESELVFRLREAMRGKTSVVIAHRMSTVRDADQIVLVDQGEVIEIGTHDELVANRRNYFNLVKNQLELGE